MPYFLRNPPTSDIRTARYDLVKVCVLVAVCDFKNFLWWKAPRTDVLGDACRLSTKQAAQGSGLTVPDSSLGCWRSKSQRGEGEGFSINIQRQNRLSERTGTLLSTQFVWNKNRSNPVRHLVMFVWWWVELQRKVKCKKTWRTHTTDSIHLFRLKHHMTQV